jgi:hypothetical protein
MELVFHHAHTQAPDLKVMEEARVREKAECEDATGIKYVCVWVCKCVHVSCNDPMCARVCVCFVCVCALCVLCVCFVCALCVCARVFEFVRVRACVRAWRA